MPVKKIRYDIAARYTAVGTEFSLCVGMMLWAGMWLDGKLGTAPVMMLAGFVIGFAAGLYRVIKQARQARKDIEAMNRQNASPADKTE
ncbi:MAG TPA: AtpZ/AtpI family protein [Phycisphaerae bacterium]|nr:AtpZ/AtpI family protein [Phycisphaerae bacterium]